MYKLTSIICLIYMTQFCFAQKDKIELSIQERFNQAYTEWKNLKLDNPHLSTYTYRNKPFNKIVKLGLEAIPYIIDRMEKDPHAFHLQIAVRKITKKDFSNAEFSSGRLGGSRTYAGLFIKWWKNDRSKTELFFNKYFREWCKYNKEEKDAEAIESLEKIKNLGVFSLPYLIKNIDKGGIEFVRLIIYLTPKDHGLNKRLQQSCRTWWTESYNKYPLEEILSSPKKIPTPSER